MKIVITATGTDRGKTSFGAILLAYLLHHGRNAIPMKPIQSGGDDLALASGLLGKPLPQACNLYSYQNPLSPHRAAELDGKPYADIDLIVTTAHMLATKHQDIMIEGAGGLLVPISRTVSMLDLIEKLDLPVILVAAPGVGTINDTCLALKAMQQRGINPATFVFKATDAVAIDPQIWQDNAEMIQAWTSVPFGGLFGYIEAITPITNESLGAYRARLAAVFESSATETLQQIIKI